VLLERILKERREKWEAEQLAQMKAKGKTPKDDSWKLKYKEPVAPDTSDLPELPDGWIWATVDQLGAVGEQPVLTGPFGTNLGKSDFTSLGVPVLTIGCLTYEGISLDKAVFISDEKAAELERYRLREGDFLFSRMASVGRAGFVSNHLEGALFNYHIMRLRLYAQALLPKFYLAYVQASAQVEDYIRKVNHGATRDGINTQQLLEMAVALPPLVEQHCIISEIERRLSLSDEVEKVVDKNIKRAEKLRQSILKKAFEGKLVPQDPTDEPADKLLERIKAEKAKREAEAKAKKKQKQPGKSQQLELF
jgi:type I restriction enzyme S subunit